MILRAGLVFLLLWGTAFSQNNVIIFSSNAGKFNAQLNEVIDETVMHQEFKFTSIEKDTIEALISTSSGLKHKQRLYLMQKARSVKNMEFVYALELKGDPQKLQLVFISVHDIKPLPNPLLPEKPNEDTTYKWRNNVFGTLFELKEGKPVFYFNLPKDGECQEGMSESDLKHATTYLARQPSDFERFNHASEIVKNNCLTCAQLATIINSLKYELDKLKLVKLAYSNLVDKKSIKTLQEIFRFESSKKEFADMISDPKNLLPEKHKIKCVTSEKDSLVNELAGQIKLFATDYERYKFMKEKAAHYCFNCVQFKSILNLFVHDREKLDLTKLFYNNITDKESLWIVKDIFSYKESVINLENFLKNN